MTVLVVKEGLGEMRELDLQSGRMNSLSFQLES